MKAEYYDLLKINKVLLDEELVRQPQLFYDWAEASANASADKDDAKANLELIKAIEGQKIRDDNKIKLTNPEVEAAVLKNKRVIEAQKKYLECNRTDNVLAEAKSAFKQRQKSLEGLVQINMQMHFAEPNLNRNNSNDVTESYHKLKESNKKEDGLKDKKRITSKLKRSKRMKSRKMM